MSSNEQRSCQQCGAAVGPRGGQTARFCANCGHRLATTAPRRHRGRFLALAALAMLMLAWVAPNTPVLVMAAGLVLWSSLRSRGMDWFGTPLRLAMIALLITAPQWAFSRSPSGHAWTGAADWYAFCDDCDAHGHKQVKAHYHRYATEREESDRPWRDHYESWDDYESGSEYSDEYYRWRDADD